MSSTDRRTDGRTRWIQYTPPSNFVGRGIIILILVNFIWNCHLQNVGLSVLTHWGRVTHICFSKLNIIGSDNGLSPARHQAIIWTNAGILLIGPIGTNFSEISIKIHPFSLKKMHLKMPFGKWRPFCLSLNLLIILAMKQIFFLNPTVYFIKALTQWPLRDVVVIL